VTVSVNGLLLNGFNGYFVKSLCERRTPPVDYSSALATLELLISNVAPMFVLIGSPYATYY